VFNEFTVAARLGVGDPMGNPRLRLAMLKAREVNMPADNIKKAIQKGTGELEGVHYEEALNEAFGQGGVAILIETMTDNRNRAVGDIRHALDRNGGNLGQPGTVAHLFATSGFITVDAGKVDEDTLMGAALDAGADDVRREGDVWEVLTPPAQLESVAKALEAAGIATTSAEIVRLPNVSVRLEGSKAQAILRLMEALEDLDDVQKVYANFDIPESELAEAE
jgi:YebC/PmpR family DNA-binding regulatory protein